MKRILIPFVFIILFITNAAYGLQNGQANHHEKKQTTISTINKRYVVLFPQILPSLFIIKAQNGIVGYPGFGIKAIPLSGNLILKVEPNFVKKTSDIGYTMEPNIETIVKLHPDFVVNSFAKIINRRIEHYGIPVVAVPGSFGTIGQLLKSIAKLGTYTDHTEEAERYIKYYKGIISYVHERLRDTKKHPKVLYLSYQGAKGNELTSGGGFDTLVNDIIQKAGCISVSRKVPGMLGLISVEDIIKWNPDFIILGWGGDAKDVYENKLLKYVNAVKNKKVFKVPTDGNARCSTDWYTPEKSSLGLLWTAKITHPKIFKSLNLKQAASVYYRTFWGLSLKDIKIEGFLP